MASHTLVSMVLSTMNVATCAALAQVMPVLLIALIAERVGFKVGKDKRKNRYKLAIALVRTFLDFTFALFIVIAEIQFLNGIDSGGYKGADSRGLWAISILILVVILYRWFLLSPSVQYAIGLFTDWYFRVVGRFVRFVLSAVSERVAEAIIEAVSAVANVIVAGVLSISRTPPL